MKFFQPDILDKENLNDREIRAIFERYTRHLKTMQGVLPDHVLTLAKQDGVDDGLIVSVKHDLKKADFVLTMRCGNLQIGYYDLILHYQSAETSLPDMRTILHLARVSRNRWEDLAYHELDIKPEGCIEHRFLFHGCSNAVPFHEFSIRCRSLRWEKMPRADRNF